MALTRIGRWSRLRAAAGLAAVALMSIALPGAWSAVATQEFYGSVVGTVQDNSGGLIPGATMRCRFMPSDILK